MTHLVIDELICDKMQDEPLRPDVYASFPRKHLFFWNGNYYAISSLILIMIWILCIATQKHSGKVESYQNHPKQAFVFLSFFHGKYNYSS